MTTKSEDRQVYCVDFDNTLTESNVAYWDGERPRPDHDVVESTRNAYYKHHVVIIWTARPWDQAGQIASHLTEWGVPYHGIRCNKGSGDVYIDDKMLSPKEFADE